MEEIRKDQLERMAEAGLTQKAMATLLGANRKRISKLLQKYEIKTAYVLRREEIKRMQEQKKKECETREERLIQEQLLTAHEKMQIMERREIEPAIQYGKTAAKRYMGKKNGRGQ